VIGLLGIVPEIARLLRTGPGAPARALALGSGAVDLVPLVATVGLVAALLAVSWLAFRRQEL
jgi:hypothetical protein